MINDMLSKYRQETEQLIEACHRMAELGYVTSAGGNLSLKLDGDLLLITPTKTPKRTMRFEDICIVNLEGETVYAANGKAPTGETPFHTRIFKKRPDVKAIVHAHPPLMTGFAIAGSNLLEMPFLPEPVFEIGPMLTVPYETPITEALSLQFDKVIEHSNGFLMANHGAVICGINSVFEAVEMMQMAECMAQSILVSIQLGNARPISPEYVRELDGVARRRGIPIPGAPGKYQSVTELYSHG